MIRRKTYTREFKESAIDLYHSHRGEKTTKEIADELGIHQENLCRWLRESKEGEKKNIKVFPGQGNPRDEEVSRLKKENADLKETSDCSPLKY